MSTAQPTVCTDYKKKTELCHRCTQKRMWNAAMLNVCVCVYTTGKLVFIEHV